MARSIAVVVGNRWKFIKVPTIRANDRDAKMLGGWTKLAGVWRQFWPPLVDAHIVVIGAGGGAGGNDVTAGYSGNPGYQVHGIIQLGAGDTINIGVGAHGNPGNSGTSAPGGLGGYSVTGFQGGNGGSAGPQGWSGSGGGGGGATVIKINNGIVVAAAGGAGGGGGGWNYVPQPSPPVTPAPAIVATPAPVGQPAASPPAVPIPFVPVPQLVTDSGDGGTSSYNINSLSGDAGGSKLTPDSPGQYNGSGGA